ncbi:MAG TPA: outer membrane protein transport protein [Geobacteraceae bacterium]
MKPGEATSLTLIVVVAAALFCQVPLAYGSGFAVYTQGASALGQGNAVIAHGDDPTAIFYNPAQINKLAGTQVSVGTTLMFPSREFTSDTTGATAETKDTLFYPSTFYVTHKINDTVSVGLGVFSPFGLSTEWDGNWEGRYITTKSRLQTFNINPVASVQLTPAVSVAAGVDILVLNATLEKKLRSTALGIPGPSFDIGQKFDGDAIGVGYNVGVLVELPYDVALGASYRSGTTVHVTGNSSSSGAPPAVATLLNSPGTARLELPQQVNAGIAYKGLPSLTVEAGLRWEGWSSFDKLSIDLDNGQSQTTPRNWKDVFSYNVGAKYQLSESVALLGGYLYGNTPVPDNTFDPSIPDATTHVFSLGTDLFYRQFKISGSYAYQMLEERHKTNNIPVPPGQANGTYDTDIHMIALNLVYRF